jgi:hypothetical protein
VRPVVINEKGYKEIFADCKEHWQFFHLGVAMMEIIKARDKSNDPLATPCCNSTAGRPRRFPQDLID